MARLLVLGIGVAIVVIGAFNLRVVSTDCLRAFADDDRGAIFATCDAEEFRSAVREFEWELQEPDGYLDSRCAEQALRDALLCTSR